MRADQQSFENHNTQIKGVVAASLVVVGVIFVVLGVAKLSSTETVLLGVVQTFFSLLAGWIITHAYAKQSERRAVTEIEELHQRNLRTYALKAAEKVENLSRELSRLTIYLNQELDEQDYESPVEELSAKEERIQSAIHILNTLKSVNDTSLSDWRGVIGDEIEEIRLRAEQREETLEKLVDRIQRLESQGESGFGSDAQLLREMDKLRRDVRVLAGDVTGNLWSAARKPVVGSRHTFSTVCPECGGPIAVRQKVKDGSVKGVSCKACGARLVSTIKDGQPVLSYRSVILEDISCGSCNQESVIELDELIGASSTVECTSCGEICRATRTNSGVLVSVASKKNAPLTEDLIQRVKECLPSQPWPKGVHEQTALQLGVEPAVVQKAINQLILRGDFMDQFKGQLCTPAEKLALMRSMGRDL